MSTYRKKPVTVEAQLVTPKSIQDVAKWCNGTVIQGTQEDTTFLQIKTLEGYMAANFGDYVIKGVAGEFYPCKPDIFWETYETVGHTESRDYVLARLQQNLGIQPLNVMQEQVREFQQGMGQPVGTYARSLPKDRVPVRIELIREEFEDELMPALYKGDLVETADACIDLLYVTFGLLVEMGINAAPLFDEVHRSNMSKFGADGKPIIAQENDPDGVFPGRVKKGPNYFKPNLEAIIESGAADLGA
ncbi:nucleotide pyrophosphohydrolase [Microbacterium phage Schubert]|uniref:MazG-like nucleotide pyrophosphohydrolase n=1 Tax=Microbacterium phage Schubert TaxID=2500787 RepID=A0A3T0INV9_9CAUD|nr:nucleotide pyrophosphohydrolase [Microbacterium phage Schubert]AZV01748.1 MazG-like nucleotide pyrophosphohydrolase [Microbacterium phage Schubert]